MPYGLLCQKRVAKAFSSTVVLTCELKFIKGDLLGKWPMNIEPECTLDNRHLMGLFGMIRVYPSLLGMKQRDINERISTVADGMLISGSISPKLIL